MTVEQQKTIKETALKLKQALPDFYGSVTFNLSGSKNDVKIEIKEMSIAKADFVK